MKKSRLLYLIFYLLAGSLPASAKVSTMQLFYLVSQVFPNHPELHVFITGKQLESEKTAIERAAVQFHVSTKIHEINEMSNIGNGMQNLGENSILLIYDDWLFEQSKNRFYIMSKCKEKQIALITTTPEYLQSGALLGFVEQDGADRIVLNLTNYDHLKDKFNQDLIQQIGISQVIPSNYLTTVSN